MAIPVYFERILLLATGQKFVTEGIFFLFSLLLFCPAVTYIWQLYTFQHAFSNHLGTLSDNAIGVPMYWGGGQCDSKLVRLLARACGAPVGRRSGGQLVTTLVATINVLIFFPFSIATFSHRKSARIKKFILQKLTEAHKTLGVDIEYKGIDVLPAGTGYLIFKLEFC